jgi:NTE family protein
MPVSDDGDGPPSAGRIPLLRSSSLFSTFDDGALAALAERCGDRSFGRGDVVWKAGDAGTELLIVVSGRLDVWGTSADGGEQLVGTVGPGECVGEMALVLDDRRSATVTCGRATRALALSKAEFREVLRTQGDMMTDLIVLLSRRAMELARRQPTERHSLVVGVAARPGVPGASMIASAIAELAPETLGIASVLIRLGDRGYPLRSIGDEPSLPSRLRTRRGLPPVLDLEAPAPVGAEELSHAITHVVDSCGDRFRLFVLDLPTGDHAVSAAAAVCDVVVEVTGDRSEPTATGVRTLQVVNCYGGTVPPAPVNHCEPFVLPVEPSLAEGWNRGGRLAFASPLLPASRVLRRLVRKIWGVTVGVALGGGAAFGIAHVGVLAALEESGLPIDMVAGTSMGSIVALGYAAGLSPSEMCAIADRIGNVRTTLSVIDPSLGGAGMLNGNRLVSIFSPLLDRESFDELDMPCRVVAMDIDTGASVSIGSGPLDRAFRASCSIPVVFKPVRIDGRTVVDGGMIDPVPSGVLREMGADVAVAVNVVPRLNPAVSTTLSKTFKRVSRLNPMSYMSSSQGLPDLIDVFMNSLQAIQYELGTFKSLSADLLVNVDLADFTWIDFHRSAELIERGREAGGRAAVDLQAVIAERVGAPG